MFRELLRREELAFLLDDILLAPDAAHLTEAQIEIIRDSLARAFTATTSVEVWIVGSAKLGFATSEKRTTQGVLLPRYRQFSAQSDIDVAVVSEHIFSSVWDELSAHAHRTAPILPWNSGYLGDYLVCGWLRPDHFPHNFRLRRCDDWWDTFRRLSVDARFDRRKIRGGLFASIGHLRRYLQRSIDECLQAEQLAV